MIILLSAGPSFAQFPDLGKLMGNKTQDASKASLQDLANTNKKAVGNYVNSMQSIALGLEKTASAFGIKNAVTDKLAVINSLQINNLSDASILKARQASQSIMDAIKAKMGEGSGMSKNSRMLFTQGIAALASNIKGLQGVASGINNILPMAQGLLAGSTMQDKYKIQDIISTVSLLSKNIPQDIKSSQGMFSMLGQYAQSQNISLTNEAVGLLKLIK